MTLKYKFYLGNTGKQQLYWNYHLYYRHRQCYWRCYDKQCGATVHTTNEEENGEVCIPADFKKLHAGKSLEEIKDLFVEQSYQRYLFKNQ